MSALKHRVVSAVEYLALDRSSEERFELDDGKVTQVEAASREHNLIMANVVSHLHGALRGRPCEAYVNAMRVTTASGRRYCYPDVVIACGEPKFEDRHGDTLLNPTVIFEILSPSTALRDRGLKFERYRSLPTLQHYVLVEQHRAHLEIFDRNANGSWTFNDYNGLEAVLPLASIDCSLTLTQIYERVEFPPVSEDDEDDEV